MIKEGFKRGRYHGIPVYVKQDGLYGAEVEGRNWFYDKLVDLNVWLDIYVFRVEAFEILVEEDNIK